MAIRFKCHALGLTPLIILAVVILEGASAADTSGARKILQAEGSEVVTDGISDLPAPAPEDDAAWSAAAVEAGSVPFGADESTLPQNTGPANPLRSNPIRGDGRRKYRFISNPSVKIPNEYIITLRPSADIAAVASSATETVVTQSSDASNVAAGVKFEWDFKRFKGFSVRVSAGSDANFLQAWADHPDVISITDNGFRTTQQTGNITQTGTPWGLGRIDQRDQTSPADTTYSYTSNGEGVFAYVIDTGVRTAHTQFTGRVATGLFTSRFSTVTDSSGHGTHVSGTIAGTTFGVAKRATIVPIKVCSRSFFSTSDRCFDDAIISAINLAVRDTRRPNDKKVINMSLGGPSNSAMDSAINAAVDQGVTVVVAGSNNGGNACSFSPARAAKAITVGATTTTDQRASYSNFGSCLDIFAPGSNIQSSWIGSSNTGTNTISGTSMACPHVTGMVARILGAGLCTGRTAPQCVLDILTTTATAGKVGDARSGSPNRLLYRDPSL